MGGKGSGRRPVEGGSRQTTDQRPALDVRSLKRERMIAAGQERVDVLMRFRKRKGASTRGPKQVELVERLRLTWTPCNYGGSRPWFICPGDGCGRRVAIVYGPTSPLLCRRCNGLSYTSQRATRKN